RGGRGRGEEGVEAQGQMRAHGENLGTERLDTRPTGRDGGAKAHAPLGPHVVRACRHVRGARAGDGRAPPIWAAFPPSGHERKLTKRPARPSPRRPFSPGFSDGHHPVSPRGPAAPGLPTAVSRSRGALTARAPPETAPLSDPTSRPCRRRWPSRPG